MVASHTFPPNSTLKSDICTKQLIGLSQICTCVRGLFHNPVDVQTVILQFTESCQFLIDSRAFSRQLIDNYAKNGGPQKVSLLCSFYHESLRTWIKTIVNKFVTSNHTALILHALRSYLKLISEYEPHSLPNKKVSST